MTRDWPPVRLGTLYDIRDERARDRWNDLPLLSVSQVRGVVPRSLLMGDNGRADDLSSYKLCQPGDLVLNRMSAYNGALGVASQEGLVSPDYLVMIPKPRAHAKFLAAWLKTPRGVYEMTLRLRGIGSPDAAQVRTPRVNESDLRLIPVPLPTVPEQKAIIDFLERETAQIDTLIEEQKRLIELLRERRKAVCTLAVTRGVEAHVEFRDSADASLGEIPAHWTVRSIRHWLLSLDGARVPLSAEERGHMQGEFDYYGASGVIDHVSEYLFDEPLVLVSEDGANLLLRSTPIAFAAKGRYWVNNHAHVLKPLDGDVDFWAARLEAMDVSPVVSGSAQPKLTAGALMSLRVSAPTDVVEQRRIVAYIEEQTSRIDTLMAETERFIDLAHERRAALVTAAVTGQIDVMSGAA